MKKIFIIASLAAGIAVGCDKVPAAMPSGTDSSLTVSLEGLDAPGTKATTDGTASENAVNGLRLYVFDANGMLDVAHACTDAEMKAGKATLSIKTGTKTVYALANANEDLASRADAQYRLSGLEAVSYALSDNMPSGLVMRGSKEKVSVTASGGSATVKLARGVARISLGSVKNSLPAPYGTVKLVHAFLCNVVGNQNLKGDETPDNAKYLNQEATRGHAKAKVIGTGSVEAECKDLTFNTLGESVKQKATKKYTDKFFYAFPNALKTPNNGYNTTFSPTATVLMVVVSVKDTNYYYPVPLSGGLVANTEYKVDLTLSGLGNTVDNPFARIEKGELTVTVSVSPWTTGKGISEVI
ncbi:MAG: hypothetical protein K5910_08705 [Bacteroidales bacterium]|nr:hypothetical protein [Bacteroidales bacterium]